MRLFFIVFLTSALAACGTTTTPGSDASSDATTDLGGGSDGVAVDASGDSTGVDSGGSDAAMPEALYVNEINAGGNKVNPQIGADADWLELYHTGAGPMDLSGYKVGGLTNGFTGTNNVLPAGTTIAAGGFLVIYYNHFSLGTPVFNDGIKSDGSMAIWNPSGVLIDSVDWNEGASPAGATYDRIPDGGATWQTTAPPTPGKPNGK